MMIYSGKNELYNAGLGFEGNRIFKNGSKLRSFNRPELTRSADPVFTVDGVSVVLTGNSSLYPHGILGDKNESTGFIVYRDGEKIGEYTLPKGSVFETLRPTLADIVPERPGDEIILTQSNKEFGSRLMVFSLEGNLLGESEPIGQGFRWMHLLGVAPLVSESYNSIVAVEKPHISGRIIYFKWSSGGLIAEVVKTGFSSHKIGSDNLNMALISDLDGKKGPEILIPSTDFRSLNVIKVVNGESKVIRTFKLPGKLITNIYYDISGKDIWAGCSGNRFVKISG